MKQMDVANYLIEKIEKDYKDDIAIVVIMGSHLYNATHKKSDLDLYFIPKTKRGFQLGTVFIIEGIGYDLWPISWERIANHDERIGSIITEGKVIYYGNEEDLEKFNNFKEKALDTSHVGHFVWKAKEKIKTSYVHYYELEQTKNLSEARSKGIQLIYSVTESLSLLNRTTIKRGRGRLLGEMLSMELLPIDLKNFI